MDNTINNKPPMKMYVLYILAFLAPYPYCMAFCIYNGLIPFADFMRIFSVWYVDLYLLIYTALAFITQNHSVKAILKFNEKDAREEANKVINNQIFLSITIILSNSVIGGLITGLAFKSMNIESFDLFAYLFSTIGSTCLFSTLAYILWLKAFEEWLSFVVFYRAIMKMGFVFRFMTVSGLVALGIVSITLASILVPAYSDLVRYELVLKALPQTTLATILSIVDYAILTLHIKRRITFISNNMRSLSKGDYRLSELPVISRDEFGILVNRLNKFFRNTKKILGDVDHSVTTITEVGKSMTNQMMQTAESMQSIVSEADIVKSHMQKQNDAIFKTSSATNEIGKNISVLATSVDNLGNEVKERFRAVQDMVDINQQMAEMLHKNNEQVDNLSKASNEGQKKIEEAVNMSEKILSESSSLMEASQVVQSIADQTNLLAMNAAIEAAHAGETGKGFAVVADEIRKLAEQSSEEGRKITEHLQGLQTVINEVSESTRQLQSQFGIIYDLTQNVRTQEDAVLRNMSIQTEKSSAMLETMKSIGNFTLEVKNNAVSIQNDEKQIESQMRLLDSATASIHQSIETILNSTNNVNEAINSGKEINDQNEQSIKSLNEEMKGFILK